MSSSVPARQPWVAFQPFRNACAASPTCAAVAPGFIATDMAEPVLAGPKGDGIRSQSSWRRVGEPSEVAAAVAFLASDEASWCTGGVVDCNGASYLH